MDDRLIQLIGYAIAALIWLLPRFLKAIAKNRGKSQAQPGVPAPTAVDEPLEEWSDYELEAAEAGQSMDSGNEYENLLEQIAQLERRADVARSEARNRSRDDRVIVTGLESSVIAPLQRIRAELHHAHQGGTPLLFDEALAYRNWLGSIESLLLLLMHISVERRRLDRALNYSVLDRVVASLMRPYDLFARGIGAPMRASRSLSVVGDLPSDAAEILARGNLSVGALEEAHLEQGHLWSLLAGDIGLGFVMSTPGLLEEARGALGMPRVLPENVVFAGPRAAVASLYHLWLPRIFADVVATLQMGRSYPAALVLAYSSEFLAEPGNRNPAVMLFSAFSDGVNQVPLAIRVAVVQAVLDLLRGGDATDSFDQDLERAILEHLQIVTVIDAHSQRVGVDARTLVVAAERVAQRLVSHRFSSLGGSDLAGVLGPHHFVAEEKTETNTVQALTDGQSVLAPVEVLLKAATVAALENPSLERKIHNSLLLSLSGKQNQPKLDHQTVDVVPGWRLHDAWQSPVAWRNAVVAGAALAPRPHLGISAKYRSPHRLENKS